MSFSLSYNERVVTEDIPKLSPVIKARVKFAIEQKLVTYPENFGKPLRRSLKGYRKLRIGDYRVIFRIESDTVKIFVILHRSVVYKKSLSRL